MRKYLPDYTTAALRRFMASWEEMFSLLHLGMRGIGVLMGMPRILEVLIETASPDDGPHEVENLQRKLARARRDAERAKSENEKNFPLLHAQTLIAAWGAFEAAIEDTLVAILIKEPKYLKTPALAKVKISLGDFHASDEEGRIRFLLAEISRSQGPGVKQGVDAFEFPLNFIGLSGPLPDELKKSVWEMHNIRNVLVHRASLADVRIVEECPWLNLKIGAPVTISHEALCRYGTALCEYCVEIARRLGKRYDVDVDTIMREAADERAKDGTSTLGDF